MQTNKLMKSTQIQSLKILEMNLAFCGSLDLFPTFFDKYSNNSFLFSVSDDPIDLSKFEQYSVSNQIFVILPIVSIIFEFTAHISVLQIYHSRAFSPIRL